MPLIIHPSSCCDICLETLTYNDKPPFAIPCGHIFCRSCLFGMNPSLCPLCRKPFLPERSKKLITGEVGVPEVEGIEDKKAIELLTKLVNSLDTEGHDSTILEVDLWLSTGNTHALLQKAHEVLKEYLVLKSERSANLRSIRRLQRDMHRLQVDQSTEKENASAMQQELLSQIDRLRGKVRKLEERRRAATTITFNHNPLPTPPEPFPLESLPFFANLQQNSNLPNENLSQRPSDRATQNTAHLPGVPADTSVEDLAAAAPRAPTPDQASIPSNPIPTVNGQMSNHRSAIIPGASPNQRFVPGTVFEESTSSARTNVYGQTAPPVDPFVLATGYFTEYAVGFEEGYHLSQRHLQSSNRQNRQERRTTEPAAPSALEPLSQSSTSPSRTLDDRLLQQLADVSITSQSVRRPLGLRDFYTTSRIDPAPGPRVASPGLRVSSPRPSTLSSSSSAPIHEEQPWVPPEWPVLSILSTSPAPLELPVTTAPVDRTSSTSSLPSPPSAPASSDSRQFLPLPSISAPPSSMTSTISSDARSSRSSRTSSSSRAREQRSRSDVTSIEISWDSPAREIPALITPDASLHRRAAFSANTSVQPSPLSGVFDSPASAHTMDSWGTVSNNSNRVPHRPFRPAHQISSVSDLGLRLFDDFTNSDAGSASQRSSLLSDATQPFSTPHIDLEESDNVGSHGSDSQNRTPRVVPRPLPETESVSSNPGILHPFVPSRDADRLWNVSNTTHSPYRDLDRNHTQHHGTPSGASETWHRATADLTSIRSNSHVHAHSHSHSISGPVSDSSSRASRHRTSRSSPIYDNSTSLRWETSLTSTNALGLTELAPSPEPRISAPAPTMPPRSFLRYYNENYR